MSQPVLGIDIAKRKLDVALIFNGQTFSNKFDNSNQGFKLLNAWLESLEMSEVHACLEPTGNYGDRIANFLNQAGHLV